MRSLGDANGGGTERYTVFALPERNPYDRQGVRGGLVPTRQCSTRRESTSSSTRRRPRRDGALADPGPVLGDVHDRGPTPVDHYLVPLARRQEERLGRRRPAGDRRWGIS